MPVKEESSLENQENISPETTTTTIADKKLIEELNSDTKSSGTTTTVKIENVNDTKSKSEPEPSSKSSTWTGPRFT